MKEYKMMIQESFKRMSGRLRRRLPRMMKLYLKFNYMKCEEREVQKFFILIGVTIFAATVWAQN